MPVNNNDLVRMDVGWRHSLAGDIVNTYHLVMTGAVAEVSDTDWGVGIHEYLGELYVTTDVIDAMSTLVTDNTVRSFNVTDGSPMTEFDLLGDFDGLGTGESLPTGVAALIVGRTAVSRRTFRKYLPPFTVAQLDDGRWATGTMAILQNYCDAIVLPFETSLGWSVRAYAGSSLLTGFSPVVTASARLNPAYQRRRKAGVGS